MSPISSPSYFNPWNSDFRARELFSRLPVAKRCAVIFSTVLGSILTVGIGSVASFRLAVKVISGESVKKTTDVAASIINKSGFGAVNIVSTDQNGFSDPVLSRCFPGSTVQKKSRVEFGQGKYDPNLPIVLVTETDFRIGDCILDGIKSILKEQPNAKIVFVLLVPESVATKGKKWELTGIMNELLLKEKKSGGEEQVSVSPKIEVVLAAKDRYSKEGLNGNKIFFTDFCPGAEKKLEVDLKEAIQRVTE